MAVDFSIFVCMNAVFIFRPYLTPFLASCQKYSTRPFGPEERMDVSSYRQPSQILKRYFHVSEPLPAALAIGSTIIDGPFAQSTRAGPPTMPISLTDPASTPFL
jgi:hypothetical protein